MTKDSKIKMGSRIQEANASYRPAKLTYDDYLSLPNDGCRYEIIKGELYMSPAPSTDHQSFLLNLATQLHLINEEARLGKLFLAPTDVILSFIDKIAQKNIVGSPDLGVEIISETTHKVDRELKKQLYQTYGVREYWLVDLNTRRVEVWEIKKGKYRLFHVFNSRQRLSSPNFLALKVDLKKCFEG
ncbi:Uma2 family endonuclease [candidate division KSB1 bacterium]|nr:MAG: Uma2 family endonuclease [candidate division KSB1 bacterium]